MNQEKECFEFVEKQIKEPLKSKVIEVLNKIKEKAGDKKWEAPALGKFPEDSEEWSMWWKDSDDHVSIDFYPDDPEKELFWYAKNQNNHKFIADECKIPELSDEIIQRIIDIKYKKVEDAEVA